MASLCVIKCGVGSLEKNMETSENLTKSITASFTSDHCYFCCLLYLVTLTVDKKKTVISYLSHM